MSPELNNEGKRWSGRKVIIFFLLAWALLNLLQAAITGLDGDEAYYWLFSRRLDWGYFDHPPMVALFIRLGEWFSHGPLFTRLGTVLLSVGAIVFGFKALPAHLQRPRWYLLVFASVPLFHVYGFVVTPDSALLFFTAVFFFAYKLFLEKETPARIVFLALSMVGLWYSKYHGVFPVLFTFLSNPRLALRPAAWIALMLALAGFVPHLIWQYHHDWASFRYHLSERIGSRYRIDKTTNYLLSQLLVWGPLTTSPLLYHFFRKHEKDIYLRAHYFTFFGLLLFFFLNSFRSTIEPHWTLAGGISFCVIAVSIIQRSPVRLQRIFSRLLAVNIILALTIRVLIVLPESPLGDQAALKAQRQGKAFADSLYNKARGLPVVFPDSYIQPALYRYYHPGEMSCGYATVFSRKNYFFLSEDQDSLNDRKVLIAFQDKRYSSSIRVNSDYQQLYLLGVDSFQAANSLKIKWANEIARAGSGDEMRIRIVLSNPSRMIIQSTGLRLGYAFIKTKKEYVVQDRFILPEKLPMKPGYERTFELPLKFPRASGRYRLVFSVVQPPLDGTFASPFYTVKVED